MQHLLGVLAAATPAPLPTSATSTDTGAAAASSGEFPTILLSCLVWSSLFAALVILLMPERTEEERGRIRVIALAGAATPLVLAFIGLNYEINQDLLGGGLSFEENRAWLHSLPVHVGYHLAADGVSLPLLLLSGLLFSVAVLASWRNQHRVKLYFFLLLLLESGVNGSFVAFDYVLFLLFSEVQLVPMFVLIAVWGGEGRMRAAWRFLGFGVCSSTLLAAAVVITVVKGGTGSSDFLQTNGPGGAGVLFGRSAFGLEQLVFWLFFLAFAIRLPVAPLHHWLPEAQGEASPPVAVILSGILLALGGYGMIRICLGSFPAAAHHFSLVLALLAAGSAVWGTVAALAQDDLKRLLAYTSVGQMAIVLLAVGAQTTIALNGAVLQIVAHGLSTAMLLLLAGAVQERARTSSIVRLGGLVAQLPKLTALWVFAALAALGVPFLAGFAAEFEVFVGSYPAHRVATVTVMLSVAVTTGCLLRMLERAFFGPAKEAFHRLRDASTLELLTLLPLGFFVVVFGVFPGRVIPVINNGVQLITARLVGLS